MSMKLFRRVRAVALPILLLLGGTLAPAQTAASPEISRLLEQAQHKAWVVNDDATELHSYTHSKLQWQTHAAQLELMKEHVNDLIGDVNQLVAMKDQGAEWQQNAIERVAPLMELMADRMTATIVHLNENQARVHMQAYSDYTGANAALAERIHKVIRDAVDYEKTKARTEALEQKLWPSEGTSIQ